MLKMTIILMHLTFKTLTKGGFVDLTLCLKYK